MEIRDFLLERYFDRHEFSVPHQMSASDCESLSIEQLLKLAGEPIENLLQLSLAYTPTRGADELRRVIAEFYRDCDADDVLVTNAPEEAIFLTMHGILKAGDRVVVQSPCYQSLAEIARSIGCDVIPWSLQVVGLQDGRPGWRADLDALASLLPGARLLVINTPHNPTGFHFAESDYEQVLALARRHGVRVLCDEMYRGLEPTADLAVPPCASRDPRSLSLWGMSKTFGLPGLRIGWLVCRDRELLDRIARLKDYTTICSSAPGEYLARLGLRCFEAIAGANRARIARNRAAVLSFMDRHASRMSWLAPVAGPISLAEVHGESATSLCQRVREEAGIMLVPSTMFDLDDRHVRLGIGRDGFAEGLARLSNWLDGAERGT